MTFQAYWENWPRPGFISIFTLIDEVFRNPAVTVASTAKLLKVTARAAAQNVERLIKLGILEEATGRKRARVFVAREVIKVLEKREEG